MKKILSIIAFLCFNLIAVAQVTSFTIVKDVVIVKKKPMLKIIKQPGVKDNTYIIRNMFDQDLVTVAKLKEKAKNGSSQYLVSFQNGQMGVTNSAGAVPQTMLTNIFKEKGIIAGLLIDDGVYAYKKAFLKEITLDETIADTDSKNDAAVIAEDDAALTAVEAAAQAAVEVASEAFVVDSIVNPPNSIIADKPLKPATVSSVDVQGNMGTPTIVNEQIVKTEGLFEDRDFSAPVLIRGKLLYQDNFVVGSFATKIEASKSQQINKIQFKNHKGRFVAEVAYVKGETVGRLYNSLDKEKSDMELPETTDELEIITDIATQLLDSEIL